MEKQELIKDKYYQDVIKKWGKTHTIEKIMGTHVDLKNLKNGQSVCWGDGETYHFRLTKKETEHPHDIHQKGLNYDALKKRNKQLLTALKSAKREIKSLHDKANGNMGSYFWKQYQQNPVMKRINKAIKDD